MPRYERSGTDGQIAAQLRRGVNVLAIRKDLGCGSARIHKVAEAEGLTVTRAHVSARMDDGEGWATVHLTYPTTDDGVITIRKVP